MNPIPASRTRNSGEIDPKVSSGRTDRAVALAKEALALNPNLSIIMISGYAEASIAEQVESIRPRAFLHKPFTITDLAQTVSRVLSDNGKA